MPNLDPWVNENNYDYEDTATKTVTNKFENHLLSIKTERQKRFILARILPIMNVNKNYRNDRLGFGKISSRSKYKKDEQETY